MPMVFVYKCCPKKSHYRDKNGLHEKLSNHCDFNVGYYPLLKLKIDGEYRFFDHAPNEKLILEKTGKSIIELIKKKEAVWVGVNVCLNCFKSDKFNFDDIKNGGECNCKEPKFVRLEELEGKTCPKCHEGVIKKTETGLMT